jgi:hypothetical protein
LEPPAIIMLRSIWAFMSKNVYEIQWTEIHCICILIVIFYWWIFHFSMRYEIPCRFLIILVWSLLCHIWLYMPTCIWAPFSGISFSILSLQVCVYLPHKSTYRASNKWSGLTF